MSFGRKKNSKRRRGKKGLSLFWGKLLVAVGMAFIAFSIYLSLEDSGGTVPGNAQSSEVKADIDSGPIKADESLLTRAKDVNLRVERVVIPSVGIDTPVKDAEVASGRWRVFEDSASFGLGSAFPGQAGNSVIFAHARQGLFLPLRKIEKGDAVYVLTNRGWHSYSVFEIKEVSPDDTSVIKDSEDPLLTLYTCSGFADMKRLIVTSKKV